MFTNIYRAIVSYTNAETGDIKVRIPTKFGNDKSVLISKIGRKKVGGVWTMPENGEQVVVTSDDESFTNVFILNVVPAAPSVVPTAFNATLDDLSNVVAPSPSNGEFLKYVSASSAWVNASFNVLIPKIYVEKFTSYTNTSWTCPAGVTQIKLTLIGAGGPAGNAEAITQGSTAATSTSAGPGASTTFTAGGTVYTALGGKKGLSHSVTGDIIVYEPGQSSSNSTGSEDNYNTYPGCGMGPLRAFAVTSYDYGAYSSRASARSLRGQDGVTQVFQVTVVPATTYNFSIGNGTATGSSDGAVIIEYVV
jgi:phage baseplate assembly protein gpV